MTATTATGAFATELADGDGHVPRWVHLLPAGTFTGRDGRGPYRVASASAVVEATRRYAGQAELPIDYDHQIDHAARNGEPALAAGWIKGLQVRPDGIWGLVQLTERAAAHVAAREYRYLSPVFQFRAQDGAVQHILRAALTNSPNLDLTALSSAGGIMDGLGKALRALLAMPAAATDDDVLARIRDLLAARQSSAADPSQFVPIGDFERVVSELQDTRRGAGTQLAEVAVSAAITGGRLPPSLRDWGLALCATNKPAFDLFVEKLPPAFAYLGTTQLGTTQLGTAPPGGGRGGKLTDNQVAICTALGIKPDDYARHATE